MEDIQNIIYITILNKIFNLVIFFIQKNYFKLKMTAYILSMLIKLIYQHNNKTHEIVMLILILVPQRCYFCISISLLYK